MRIARFSTDVYATSNSKPCICANETKRDQGGERVRVTARACEAAAPEGVGKDQDKGRTRRGSPRASTHLRLEELPGGAGLLHSELGEVHVSPAGELVGAVPVCSGRREKEGGGVGVRTRRGSEMHWAQYKVEASG